MQLRSLLIRLALAQGIGYAGMTKVLRACLKRHTVVTTVTELLALAQLPSPAAAKFAADWDSPRFQQAVQQHQKLDILTILDADYPLNLMESYHPPLVLFLQGERQLLQTPQLAVVGARQMTPYGRRALNKLLPPLAERNLTITSGLAAGTDGYAHQLALQLGLAPIGVIGTGLDVSYPRENQGLQQQVRQFGLLISEYPLGSRPARHHFPERNRIIAGLCQTLIVIEAREHSGSLITANLALQNNRNVVAVPGPIDAPLSVGCNQLIAAGAKPVLNFEHIIEEFLPII